MTKRDRAECLPSPMFVSDLGLDFAVSEKQTARLAERAFVADSHHGREEPVVAELMMEYNGSIGIFSHSRS